VSPRKRLTREESKARTRDELLRAASRLFLRNGFVDTSLSDIADEAGLTKGAVYSNFDSKEDLFLAILQGDGGGRPYATQEELAPSDLSGIDSARAFGERVAGYKPSRRAVALFLEMNAFALRNDRIRARTDAHNRAFFEDLGRRLAELLDVPEAPDPWRLGMLSQSLYVGLTMHTAFSGERDPQLFADAFDALSVLAGATTSGRRRS
jgi:AcrR family transcriptional regulator